MEKEVKLYKTLNDMRLEHNSAFDLMGSPPKNPTTFDVLKHKNKVVAKFLNEKYEDVIHYKQKHVEEIFDHYGKLIKELSEDEKSYKLPKTIKLDNGKTYQLLSDFGASVPFSFHIDVETLKSEFKTKPELLAAFCYVEKGLKYSQLNDYKAVVNPLQDRAEVFKKYFPLGYYYRLNAFFLNKFQKLENGFHLLRLSKLKTQLEQMNQMSNHKDQPILNKQTG